MKSEFLLMCGCVALFAGCATAEKKPMAAVAATPPPASAHATAEPAGPAAPVAPIAAEKVRNAEALKAYPINRYVDPNDPNVMHEGHVIYRREISAGWNLTPTAPTTVQLGPGLVANAEGARQPNPLSAELEQKIAEQNHLMASLIEQNESLAKELARLNGEIAVMRQKQSAFAVTEEKK